MTHLTGNGSNSFISVIPGLARRGAVRRHRPDRPVAVDRTGVHPASIARTWRRGWQAVIPFHAFGLYRRRAI